MKIGKKKFVELSYILTVDGEVADQATDKNPLGFVFGEGMLLPVFEKNIENKKKGDKFEFTLTPEEGYGEVNPQMAMDLPLDVFRVDGEIDRGMLETGNEIPMMTSDGMRVVGRVISVDDETVKMDFNHPMAGKTLNFSGEILGVRDAVDADYPHRHDDGCGCGCDDSGCDDCGCGC